MNPIVITKLKVQMTSKLKTAIEQLNEIRLSEWEVQEPSPSGSVRVAR